MTKEQAFDFIEKHKRSVHYNIFTQEWVIEGKYHGKTLLLAILDTTKETSNKTMDADKK